MIFSVLTKFVKICSSVCKPNASVGSVVEPAIIALENDIELTGPLVIPEGKIITLVSEWTEGFWKLTGIDGAVTIIVEGMLTLDIYHDIQSMASTN